MPNTTIVLNEIFVDLGAKSAKSNVGRWEIQVEEPKRDKFFSKFSLDIQKKVILYLDELKAEDFKIDDKGQLLSISLKDEKWGYGEKKEIVLDSLHTFFHITVNPLAILDCLHKQSEDDNVYPIFFSIVLEDCTKSEIDRIPVCFNVKLGKKTNKPSVTIELNSSEQVFNSDLKDEKIGVVKIENPATLNYCPNISGKLRLQVFDMENNQIDGNVYLDAGDEDGYIDFGPLESGEQIEYDIKANYPGIGNPVGMENVYEITGVCDDANGMEIGKVKKEFTIRRNETQPQMLVALRCGGKDVYVENGEEVHDAFQLVFSNEQDLNMPCLSFNILNGSKDGLDGMGVVVKNIKCMPELFPRIKALFRNGMKIDDVFGLHYPNNELLQSGESKNCGVSFRQNDIVEMYTLNGSNKDFNTEIAFKISFVYWDCAEILDLNNLPDGLKKEFSFTVVKRLYQRPGSKWLAIDYGTSAIVARFADSMLKLRDKKLKLFGVKTDPYEEDTQYLSSSVVYRNNRTTPDDQSSLICDYDDENELPDYNSLAITLSPTKEVEDQNINFILPCMKMLMGYDYIPNITQYSGYTYSYRSEGQVIEQPLFNQDEEGRIIPSKLCKVSNIMYEVYKELFLYYIKGDISNPRMLSNIVLTVPNTFSPNHFLQLRGIISESFKEYNIRNLKFISESDAVACYYFRNWASINRGIGRTDEDLVRLRSEEKVLVYDMGAGTLDLTYLIRMEGSEIEVQGRMGIAKAGNYLDGLLAKIISDKAESLEGINNLKRISDPVEITNTDRLVAARKLKEMIKNKFKPILYKDGESLILRSRDFANIGIRQDIKIPVGEITQDQRFIDYIKSCTSGTLNNFFDFYRIGSVADNLRVDTIIISGRASKLSFIQKQLSEYLQSLVKRNPIFRLVDMSTVMKEDKSKDVVAEGAMAYALQNNLKIKYNNIMANYGIFYYDSMGDLKYAEILNPRTTKPTASQVVEGMIVNQYVTEEVVCDISGCQGNDRPLTLVQSYSQNTLDDWKNENHEYITVMSQWRNLGGVTASHIKIEVDGDNRMRLFIDGAFTDSLAPSHIDVNSELNKRSMWPILYR